MPLLEAPGARLVYGPKSLQVSVFLTDPKSWLDQSVQEKDGGRGTGDIPVVELGGGGP